MNLRWKKGLQSVAEASWPLMVSAIFGVFRFRGNICIYLSKKKNISIVYMAIYIHKCLQIYSANIQSTSLTEPVKRFPGFQVYFPHNVDFRGRAYPVPCESQVYGWGRWLHSSKGRISEKRHAFQCCKVFLSRAAFAGCGILLEQSLTMWLKFLSIASNEGNPPQGPRCWWDPFYGANLWGLIWTTLVTTCASFLLFFSEGDCWCLRV